MALAANYQTVTTFSSSTALYTVPSTGNFGTYARDLVITNSGTVSAFFAVGTGASSAATTSSFVVPSGGSVILTECQVPASAIIYGIPQSGTASASIGFATLVTAF